MTSMPSATSSHCCTWLTTVKDTESMMPRHATTMRGELRPRNFGEKIINRAGMLVRENRIEI